MQKISDKAVQDATGKTWKEWFSILDSAGADKMNHKEIVKYLVAEHEVAPWWQQSITVRYEQERGHREKYQTSKGYEAGVSKTVASPLSDVYKHWNDQVLRTKWLTDAVVDITTSNKNKSMRIKWADGYSNLEVYFYPKGENKTQVVVQHTKLANADEVTNMKNYWKEKLENLKNTLSEQ